MQKRAGEKEVAIDLRIVLAHQVAGMAERDHVVQQAADESVVQGLGSGRCAIGFGNLRVSHESFEQGFEVGITKTRNVAGELPPEPTDVFGGLGEVVGVVDF